VKCRYGGEEFLVLLPDTPTGGAHRVAEMLRKDLEQQPVYWNEQTLAITASFGIADMVVSEDTPTGIIARADGALYDAKQNGRNCVRMSEPSPVQYQVAGVRRGGG
jgi:diguanylate cyclase (GGDEF)-like protein